MLRSLKDLLTYNIEATDGGIGHVHDFYFDDVAWNVRYLVADTGSWLPGRKVLLSPVAIESADWDGRKLCVNLPRTFIKESPPVDTEKPISRQKEEELTTHFHWPAYWGSGLLMPITPPPAAFAEADRQDAEAREIKAKAADPNLRSVHEIIGYSVNAVDGRIGYVGDFIVDDETWNLKYMVVSLGELTSNREFLVFAELINLIDWSDSQIYIGMKMEQIEKSPLYDPSNPVNEQYEIHLYDFYGKQHESKVLKQVGEGSDS